jgi:3-hydroxyacyl-CoA dehydrogenase/enoyl-CoA hydratase/3-hydroxybutyryl-CoA epimerase
MTSAAIWKKSVDDDNLVCLSLDMPNSQTNILTQAVIDALSVELDQLLSPPPRGVIIRSEKQNGFIAGADINTFAEQYDIEETFSTIKQVQAVFNRLAALPCPTVALIHGFCLGGGLELALACQYRIADNAPTTRIGLPEVKLGIHPGYGGSVRLIDLIGVIPAMIMMLSGRILSAHAAKKLSVIDASVPTRQLFNTARRFLLDPPPRQTPPLHQRLLSRRLLRPAVGYLLRRKTAQKVLQKHYPAPFALIECWQKRPADRQAYFAAEASSVATLIQTAQAQNLVRLFLLQDRLKVFGKQSDFKARHVHVIGAGTMGGDIAAWCALRGLNVTLQDQSAERIVPALIRAHTLFQRHLKTPYLIQAAMDRLMPDLTGTGLAKADVVIEAIFEDLAAKQALFATIEPQLQPHALLASNTSSIPLDKIAEHLQQPERLVGLHFFNPVAKMQLIEIVEATTTDAQWSQHATAFARQIGRLPLPVKSAPGFLINRLLMPYLLEAILMVEEGLPATVIDQVAVDFGMPIGPIALADQVGLDICLSVAQVLGPSLGFSVPTSLEQAISGGHLGRKSGQGFYHYTQKGNKKEVSDHDTTQDVDKNLIQQRLILRLLNECISCLADHIVEDSDLLDAGMVFATGFAPFHGGPMRYLQQEGAASLYEQLTQLQSTFGNRFSPHSKWETWL